MIIFKQKQVLPSEPEAVVVKPGAIPEADATDDSAATRSKKSDTDGTKRRKRQTSEANRLI